MKYSRWYISTIQFLFFLGLVASSNGFAQGSCEWTGSSCTVDAECSFCDFEFSPGISCTDSTDCRFCDGNIATYRCYSDSDCFALGNAVCENSTMNGSTCFSDDDCPPNLPENNPNRGYCSTPNPCTSSGVTCLAFACLPVELLQFSAKAGPDNLIHLEWSTATENNNAGFEIQISLDNEIFVPIDFVAGFGSTELEQNYSYKMNPETKGVHFIRLKQIDFDGAFEFTDAIEVTTHIPGNFKIYDNYPNPFTSKTNIRFVVSETLPASLKIFDSMGREIETLFDGIPESGMTQILEFDGRYLSTGTYYAKLITPIGTEIRTISLLK